MSGERKADIGIYATSGRWDREHEKYFKQLLHKFDDKGIKYVVGDLKTKKQEEQLLGMEAVSFMMCLTGGYSVPNLDVNRLAKVLVEMGCTPWGYSDNDIINLLVVSHGGVAVNGIHAGMATTWAEESVEQGLSLVKDGEYPEIRQEKMNKLINPGKGRGVVLAGGISQIMEWLAMDNFAESMGDVVLFIEDNDQDWETHFRNLMTVLNNEQFRKKIKAVVIGRRPGMGTKGEIKTEAQVIKKYKEIFRNKRLFPERIPVGIWEGFGHADNDNYWAKYMPIILGEDAEVEMTKRGQLSLEYRSCRLRQELYTK